MDDIPIRRKWYDFFPSTASKMAIAMASPRPGDLAKGIGLLNGQAAMEAVIHQEFAGIDDFGMRRFRNELPV
jgi:hypothetical protein